MIRNTGEGIIAVVGAHPHAKRQRAWQEELGRTVDWVAGLTAVDGAVILTDTYEMLGFGAKIARRRGWEQVNQVVVTEPIQGAVSAVVHPEQLGGTRHLSAYGLIYEDGTPLKGAVERGVVKRLSPEEEGAHYRAVMDTLDAGGLPQYEISNYAQPGLEARHNLVYWRNEAYLGVGVSAASFVDFERTVNFIHMDQYMAAAEALRHDPNASAIDTRERLEPEARAREALILELRLARGVDADEFKTRWEFDFLSHSPVLARYLSAGLMEQLPNGRVRISRAGMPVADGILADFV